MEIVVWKWESEMGSLVLSRSYCMCGSGTVLSFVQPQHRTFESQFGKRNNRDITDRMRKKRRKKRKPADMRVGQCRDLFLVEDELYTRSPSCYEAQAHVEENIEYLIRT